MKIWQLTGLVNFSDFPFDHELTEQSVQNLLYDGDYAIVGFCPGNIIGRDGRVVFRAGYDQDTTATVRAEYEILMQLQRYDFVPRIYCLKEFGRYTILFTELIDAIDLDKLSLNSPRRIYGIIEGLKLVHRLYCDIGFIHDDLHPGNILIDRNDKIYLIDFTTSIIPITISERKTWTGDTSILTGSLYKEIDRDLIWQLNEDLAKDNKSISKELYLEQIIKIQNAFNSIKGQ